MSAIAFALALSSQQAKPRLYDGKPLFDYVCGQRTGTNGYEEFIDSIDKLDRPALSRAEKDIPTWGQPNFLTGQRALWKCDSGSYSLVAKGVEKGSRFPMPEIDISTLFPQFADFKRIQKMTAAGVAVDFAEGRPLAACKKLETMLAFATQLSDTGEIISYFVGAAMLSIATQSFARYEAQIPLDACAGLERQANAGLATGCPKSNLVADLKCVNRTLDRLVQSPKAYMLEVGLREKDFEPDIDGKPSRNQQWCDQSPSYRASAANSFRGLFTFYSNQAVALLERPESQWEESADPLNNFELPWMPIWDILGAGPQVLTTLKAEVIRRTRLRLLRLHVQVIRHKWVTGQLPQTLAELPDTKSTFDPVTEKPFQYLVSGATFDAWAEGTKKTGPIRLAKKSPSLADEDDFTDLGKP